MNNFLETIIFFYTLKHPELADAFKPEFFSSRHLTNLFEILKPYVTEYKAEPSLAQAIDLVKLAGKDNELTRDILEALWNNHDNVSQYDDRWLAENTKSFAEWQNIMQAIQRMITYVKTIQNEVTFENCADIVNKIKTMFNKDSNFSIGVSKGHDFFDVNSHLIAETDTWKTGYPFFDMCLDGGWAPKTLNVLMGTPKIGKSMWLCNLAANSIKNGDNTCYITLEMAFQKMNHRIGSNLFNIPKKDYKQISQNPELLREKMKEFFASMQLINPGKFYIEEFPTSTMTASMLENFLLSKEEELSTPEKKFKFKVIYLDYINITADQRKGGDSLYIKIKNICEDLRAVAQRNNWAIVSATQVNRKGIGSTDLDMSDLSESMGLAATVDSLFGIIQNPLMKADNTYYIKGIAIRDADQMGNKKKFKMDPVYLRITEDPTEDIITEGTEVPKVYANSTGTFTPKSDVVTPEASKATIANANAGLPQLGLSEAQISAQDLFKI